MVQRICLAAAALWAAPVNAQPPKDYAQEYRETFKSGVKPTDWEFAGPRAEECVRFESGGARITLLQGWKGSRPNTGLAGRFKIKGDCEITLSFEILHEPDEKQVAKTGTRVSLHLTKDTPLKDTPNREVATLSRSVGPTKRQSIITYMRLWDHATGKDAVTSRTFPNSLKTGRLRIVRNGAQVKFWLAPDETDVFEHLATYQFGIEDIDQIQIVCSTGGETSLIDVRVSDLHVRADALVRESATAAGIPPTGSQPAGSPPSSRLVMLLALITAAGIAFVAVAILLRKRHRTGCNL